MCSRMSVNIRDNRHEEKAQLNKGDECTPESWIYNCRSVDITNCSMETIQHLRTTNYQQITAISKQHVTNDYQNELRCTDKNWAYSARLHVGSGKGCGATKLRGLSRANSLRAPQFQMHHTKRNRNLYTFFSVGGTGRAAIPKGLNFPLLPPQPIR